LQEIEAAILGLSEQDRLHFADKILRSLPKPPGAMESEETLAEAIRRDQELESDALEPLTEEAFWASVRRGGACSLSFIPRSGRISSRLGIIIRPKVALT